MAAGLMVLLSGWAGAARAQEAPPAAPQVAAEPTPGAVVSGVPADAPAAPAPPPPPAPPAVDLSAKVDEADQIARIAARKIELLEEQLATRAKESPSVLADDKGLGIRSADGGTSVRIHALIQADSRWFLDDNATADRLDTFLMRRVRPSIDGTLFNLADYRVVPDFAGSTAVLFDAYADIHPFPWARLRAGKYKSPLGLERLQSDPDTSLPERALTQYLTPNRDLGISLWGDIAGGVVNYNIGIYNGGFDNANVDVDSNHAKDFVGRLLIQPFKLEGLKGLGALGIHLAASTGDRRGLPTATLLPQFRTAGMNTFFSYLAPASDPDGSRTPFAYLTQRRLNPGLFYYFGPFGVLGEVVWNRQQVRKGNTIAKLTHKAAHATASFVLGGKLGFDGVTPSQILDLSKGTLGALELAVRWSWIKADAATFPDYADITRSASRAQSLAGALNYVPSRTLRLTVAYERTTFTGGAGTTAEPKNRSKEAVVIGRVQVNF